MAQKLDATQARKALGIDSVAASGMGGSVGGSMGGPAGAAPTDELDLTISSEQFADENFADSLESWDLNPAEVELGKEIGKGAFGTVYRGKLRGQNVAIKKLNAQQMDEKQMEAFSAEVEVMSKLRHPNVLLFMGACTVPGHLMIVTELMPGGNVQSLLSNKKVKLPFKTKMRMAKQAAQGMAWLHTMKPPFIHRDLKTGNLLVTKNMDVKVADFGLSFAKKEESESGEFGVVGTPLWMAPEVLDKKPYDESADLYSFGIILWELLTGETPFGDIHDMDELVAAVVGKAARPPIPDACPRTLRKLIQKCWEQDSSKRPKFTDIIPLFDAITLEALIGDKIGRKFWRKHFVDKDGLRDKAPWDEFSKAFAQFFKEKQLEEDDARYKCLEALIVKNGEVSIEDFSKNLQWFGPLKDFGSYLDSIVSLLRKSWFHGDISSGEAEKIIMKFKKKGGFLVRFSSDPGSYAISGMSQGGRLKHFRIYHKPGLDYLIGKAECKSLEEIIAKFHKELYLKIPCPGSKYEDIFTTAKAAKQQAMAAGYQVPDLDD